jgi:murein DD-endopeptidase MepM/ murein hydrolase activator NlpD
LPIAPNSFITALFMLKRFSTGFLCGCAVAGQMHAQEVVVPRETKPSAPERAATMASEQSSPESAAASPAKSQVRKKKSPSSTLTVEEMRKAGELAAERLKNQARVEQTSTTGVSSSQSAKAEANAAGSVRKEVQVERTSAPRASNPGTSKSEVVDPVRPKMIEGRKPEPTASQPAKTEVPGRQTTAPQASSLPLRKQEEITSRQTREPDPISALSVNLPTETAFTRLANGFDFPVGPPDAQGYYKARGFRSHGHLGEDWDGTRGGNTDLGDPIYSIGDGLVVFARDCHMGWGNVIIVRHAYRENGTVKNIDVLYGHLDSIAVRRGQAVSRGQKIAAMGTAHGLYDAHLHLEIRKNIEIGMSRAAFARDFSNYYDPSQFILAHRHLQTSWGKYRIAMNTFTHDALIRWDTARDYSHHRGGTSESAAALKRAVASEH